MNPIPNEVRKRILDDCNNGMSRVAAAEKWGVSSSFITKLKRHVRETGSIEPKNGKRGPKSKLEPCHDRLKKIVPTRPTRRWRKFVTNCRSRSPLRRSSINCED